jgi:tetratricopeptide (TPR) repeat protein
MHDDASSMGEGVVPSGRCSRPAQGIATATSNLATQSNLISLTWYIYVQRYKEAVNALEEALKLDPANDGIKNALRQMLLVALEEALKLDPANDEIKNALRQMLLFPSILIQLLL